MGLFKILVITRRSIQNVGLSNLLDMISIEQLFATTACLTQEPPNRKIRCFSALIPLWFVGPFLVEI